MTAAGAAALAVLLAGAQARAQGVDDSDLSVGRGPRPKVALEGRLEGRTLAFPLTGAGPAGQGAAPPGSVSGTFLLPDRQGGLQPARQASAALVGPDGKAGRTIPVSADGSWALPIDAALSGTFRVRLTLGGALWSFEDPGTRAGYAWDSPGFTLPSPEPVRLGALSPAPGSENAKVGLIHLTYLETLDAFERHGVGRGWWDRTLTVYWPDGSDYFSSWGFELHLTAPEAWDVNLHELGHALMHASMRAAGAGGPDMIDYCYVPAMAWSEGWATFFAAAVHLEPSDPDARFE
ncbi:MAG: hypothetical protein HY554_18485, partial [Elusimicrobia bacterium]|nr:hypothetical protein [Elusimicrobiota bacterium]